MHCGVLTIRVDRKLGLPCPFQDPVRNPLDLQPIAAARPTVSAIIPHFSAGMFYKASTVTDLSANVLVNTSSSNGWIKT